MRYTLYNGLMIINVARAISGCSTIASHSDTAGNVSIIKKGSISKNCKLKGRVSEMDGARGMSTPAQHSNLKTDQFYNLRDQAIKLGANTILLSPSSGMSDKKHWAAKSQHSESATHIYSGNAYWCPAN